ncbi:MAG: CcmD family protein [Candidatus Tectomicrobia bacterium]|uniref:CcmD family protein n=1 Tax=Tectimicrobiota bacterium TaxID=2528274 RepID=A0A933GJW8_UNCTE|nr:CcmD family protein [Candidatus Tectomicrobia bacterium]
MEKNFGYLLSAFIIIWLGHLIFLLRLLYRQSNLNKELALLRELVKEKESK